MTHPADAAFEKWINSPGSDGLHFGDPCRESFRAGHDSRNVEIEAYRAALAKWLDLSCSGETCEHLGWAGNCHKAARAAIARPR